MKIEAMGQWGPCEDVRGSPRQGATLAVAAKTHSMVEVHRVLVHPSEEITQKPVNKQWESRQRASEDPARCACRGKQNGRRCRELTVLTRPEATALAIKTSA